MEAGRREEERRPVWLAGPEGVGEAQGVRRERWQGVGMAGSVLDQAGVWGLTAKTLASESDGSRARAVFEQRSQDRI